MGVLLSIIDQNFLIPKATWTPEDLPDLTSHVMIVTGGNSGLGRETAKAIPLSQVLLLHNAKVYLACRSTEKGEAAIAALETETGKRAVLLPLDLASLDSIKEAAAEFQRQESCLHVLFNNAGVMAAPVTELTREGYDLQFGVNVLGHFYLAQLLLPRLKEAVKTSPDHVARIINTSSQAHVFGSMNFEALTNTAVRSELSPDALYAQSKFGNIVFSSECSHRYASDGVISIALHPGMLTTNIGRHLHPLKRCFAHALCHCPPQGALTQLWAGTAPEAASMNGKVCHPHPSTLDREIGAQLWQWLENQVQDRY
ncbi:NAD(P)-binding protein [Mycena metata]|uniref:NAD(P)-binding protein n=1 Tax=Mycena metata TaxID=1033252 RepID=A0AAD7IXI9_9AGAR|nr:NAD(P)-binding protein [Mycena metata]